MVKAACQCEGCGRVVAVARITGPYSNCCLPSADKPSICDQITLRNGFGDTAATGSLKLHHNGFREGTASEIDS
jgi:hypothetical protein